MDIDASVLDHHAFDHGTDELLSVFEREHREWPADGVDEGVERHLQLRLLKVEDSLALQYRKRTRHVGSSLAEERLSSSELIKGNQSGLIGVQQTLLLAIRLGELLLKLLDVVRREITWPRRCVDV
jgi:hypothetical protein